MATFGPTLEQVKERSGLDFESDVDYGVLFPYLQTQLQGGLLGLGGGGMLGLAENPLLPALSPMFAEEILGLQQRLKRPAEALYEAGQAKYQAGEEMVEPLPEPFESAYRGLGVAARQTPALALGPMGGAPAVLAGIGAQTGAESYAERRQTGYSLPEAALRSSVDVGVEVGTELLPMRQLFKRWGKKWLPEALKFVGLEAGTEYAAETLNALVDIADKYQDMSWAEYVDRMAELSKVLPTAILGTAGIGKGLQAAKGRGVGLHTVYHGSPHRFEKFKTSQIGTGEGAQAYGHGLYFAESPGVAHSYQTTLTSTIPGAPEGSSKILIEGAKFPKGRAGHAALDMSSDIEQYLEYRKLESEGQISGDMMNFMQNRIDQRVQKWLSEPPEWHTGAAGEDMNALVEFWVQDARKVEPDRLRENRGALYKVEIPDEAVGRMLDWDKPLLEQPKSVRKGVEKYRNILNQEGEFAYMTGADVYKALVKWGTVGYLPKGTPRPKTTYELASAMLSAENIPGIRYLDQQSRTPGKQKYNARWDKAGTGVEVFDIQTGDTVKAFKSFKDADAWMESKTEGTRNLVLFDESLAKILEIDGQPVEQPTIPAGPGASQGGAVIRPSEARKALQDRVLELRPDLAPPKETVPAEDIAYTPGPLPAKIPGLNLAKVNTSEDIKAALFNVQRTFPSIDEARGAPISWDETNAEARALSTGLGVNLDKMRRLFPEPGKLTGRLRAMNILLANSASATTQLAQRAAWSGAPQDLLAFQEYLYRHKAIQEEFSKARAEAGRMLNILRQEVSTEAQQLRGLDELISQHGGQQRMETIAAMVAEMANQGVSSARISNALGAAAQPTKWDKFLHIWINSLLSGPQTHAVNFISNAATQLYATGELVPAATLGKLHGGEKVYMREIPMRLAGLISGIRDGLVLGAHSMATGEATSPGTKIEAYRAQQPWSVGKGAAVGAGIGAVAGAPLGIPFLGAGFGAIVGGGIPGRALTAADEFYKAIGYRASIWQQATHQAIQEGLKGQALRARITELKNNPTDEMDAKATEEAEYLTYTRSTRKGGNLAKIAQGVQLMAGKVPAVRIVAPFIRTPTNIAEFALERTPMLNFMLGKDHTDALRGKKGNVARDMARARLMTGGLMAAWVISEAFNGMITGGGPPPDEPEKRRVWEENHQPYSIKIGDKWYAYQRIEPMGMVLGMAADYAHLHQQLSRGESDALATMVLAAFARNLSSKTFLRGMTDLAKAFNDPGRFGENYARNLIGTAVPTGIAQVARTQDPTGRITRAEGEQYDDPTITSGINRVWDGMLAKIHSRIPGKSKDLAPFIDLWGRPSTREGSWGPDLISPIYQASVNDDPYAQWLWDIQVYPGRYPKTLEAGEWKLTPAEQADLAIKIGQNRRALVEDLYEMMGPGTAVANTLTPEMIRRQVKDNLQESRRDVIDLWTAERAQTLVNQRMGRELEKMGLQ